MASVQDSCENIFKKYKQNLMYVAKGAAQWTHRLLTLLLAVPVGKDSKARVACPLVLLRLSLCAASFG